ncbi:glycosyltransferase family 2 protein [Vibrio kanaloae]|uniref:glycosyltransferase family 2 protein n=1 Tax=Vibrio kanaloae TaxID=170673 RepID=UPI00148CA7AD|nr:glycosyltransferase family 2 protein [Vibrio kanaloae]NOI03218.1 glycosyltransferase family 2 protein [Vibrio kanaloae]
MKIDNPLISIVTPMYNCSDYISRTIESVLAQTYSNWELLLVDDCSSDNTLDVVTIYENADPRIRVIVLNENSGAAVARNTAISESKGEYLCFIDSDDLWSTEKLSFQLSFMKNNDVDFSFTAFKMIDKTGSDMGKIVDAHLTEPLCYSDMLKKKATLGCSTVMLNKNCHKEIAMPLLRTGQDYALWLKILKSGVNAYPINCALTSYRITPNSISRNKLKKARRQWEIYRDIEQLPIQYALSCFIFYAWRAVFRK